MLIVCTQSQSPNRDIAKYCKACGYEVVTLNKSVFAIFIILAIIASTIDSVIVKVILALAGIGFYLHKRSFLFYGDACPCWFSPALFCISGTYLLHNTPWL